uniref:S53 family peptidase n=1 Tax=uncultured Sphingomonas sp. TaxID=158754 RepID=UPI0035C958DE
MTPLAATQSVTFEVFLPLRNRSALEALLRDQQKPGTADYHRWLAPDQFARQFGPLQQDMAAAEATLTSQGFVITAQHTRSFQVSGPVSAVQRSLGTTLSRAQFSNGATRIVPNTIPTLPASLRAQGATVVMFSGRPPLHSNARYAANVDPNNRYSAAGGYWFTDLKQAYDYPSYQATANGKILDGSGVSVAILMSNDVLDSDIATVFNHEKFTAITGKPVPAIRRVLIDGGAPFDPDASFEASLDVQTVLGGAPGATVTLVNTPDLSDKSIIDGYLHIIESNQYDIVNSSFGGCELFYTAAYNGGQDYTALLSVYDDLFKQGNAQGITFVASSGDEGGLSCPDTNYFAGTGPSRFVPSIQFPSDSPNVTGVGGGNLITSFKTPPTLRSTYVSENALGDPEIAHDPYGVGANVAGGFWGAGGGISVFFPKPDYQALVNTGSPAFRTTPDVGMLVGGCPGGIALIPCGPNRSYVIIAIGGQLAGVIGTSVSSPEFVSAAALYIEKTGQRAGNLNPYLYSVAARQNAGGTVALNRAIPGFDGKWTGALPAGGYTYLVGNGTPKVRALFGMLDVPAAGDPQTASNP